MIAMARNDSSTLGLRTNHSSLVGLRSRTWMASFGQDLMQLAHRLQLRWSPIVRGKVNSGQPATCVGAVVAGGLGLAGLADVGVGAQLDRAGAAVVAAQAAEEAQVAAERAPLEERAGDDHAGGQQQQQDA